MCTLTIVPTFDSALDQSNRSSASAGIRVGCNRDESRLRPAALPPRITRHGVHRAIMPVDPVSDGTWLAASDAGLILALLNAHPFDPAAADLSTLPRGPLSRGTIIPSLLSASTLEEALAMAETLNPAAYPPFRLLIVDRSEVVELSSLSGSISLVARVPLERPVMFTSSGLGAKVIEPPRRQLFDELLASRDAPEWPAAQDAYHRHCWPEAPHLSVCVSHPQGGTVSYSVVELNSSGISLDYRPRLDTAAATAGCLRLELVDSQGRAQPAA